MERHQRVRVEIQGVVQGVGFRPFVHRLASELALTGWVRNDSRGVILEAEGPIELLNALIARLPREAPARSEIAGLHYFFRDPLEDGGDFQILESALGAGKTAFLPADTAVCADCLREVYDPADRRYFYPFTNCTQCGPRFSIIEGIPYDRARTTMKTFGMCPDCQREYDDPADRRFHAQPNACPVCGPSVELWDREGCKMAGGQEAVIAAADFIRRGKAVAVKGLGGFHLMADAASEQAVAALRKAKHREEKPFALMFPNLAQVREVCDCSVLEEQMLTSPEAPIVLLLKKNATSPLIAPAVAPGNPYLGVMLPYTPLHHLLLREFTGPVVATSGNISDEPICIDEHEALRRLGGIADVFLVHNRPVARPMDDSVVRLMAGRPMVIRRARGYAPLPVRVSGVGPGILAVGGHLKNTVAVSTQENIFLSQHIGDLETKLAFETFKTAVEDLRQLYEVQIRQVVTDAHPQYVSAVAARAMGWPVTTVQHHYAHIAACLADNAIEPPALGVCWDGTGYGTDGTIWGGEFLTVTGEGFHRVGTLRSFPLPGGEAAMREPRRAALGVLYELAGAGVVQFSDLPALKAFSDGEVAVLVGALDRGLNAPRTSSMGRIFDAVASLTGLHQHTRFEGQAAMALEFVISDGERQGVYPFQLNPAQDKVGVDFVVDWQETIYSLIKDVRQGIGASVISARFHNTLVEIAVASAYRAGQRRVAMSGGCFQNKYLTERLVQRLREEGFLPYWHQRVPPNDGGIALGQIASTRPTYTPGV